MNRLIIAVALCWQVTLAVRTVGTNPVLGIDPSARSVGMGGAGAASVGDPLTLMQSPAGLADLDADWIAFAHVEHFEDAVYDHLAGALPLDSVNHVALSISRYSVDGIPYTTEADSLLDGYPEESFAVSDWVVSGFFSHRRKWADFALALHLLYRDLYDQSGVGFRMDAAFRAQLPAGFRAGLRLEGVSSSVAAWEHGETEYSPMDAFVGLGWSRRISYLYGTLILDWRSAGLRSGAYASTDWLEGDVADTSSTASVDLGPSAVWYEPWQWLQVSGGGMEFAFDWGGSVRAGWRSFASVRSLSMGAGFQPRRWLALDYAFEPHPQLSSTHRVGMRISLGRLLGKDSQNSHAPAAPQSGATQSSAPKDTVPAAPIPSAEDPAEAGGTTYWEE